MIFVTKNDEGYWMHFKLAGGREAVINVENKIFNGTHGSIEETIFKTCEQDCIIDNSKEPSCDNGLGETKSCGVCGEWDNCRKKV
jgi:hypothetical protein